VRDRDRAGRLWFSRTFFGDPTVGVSNNPEIRERRITKAALGCRTLLARRIPLPPFADLGRCAFLNIDCDIYSSTNDVFTALEEFDRLEPGVVIYFDELINYADYMWNESLALFEMCERTGLGVEWICHNHKLRSPVETAQHFHDGTHPTWLEDNRSGHWMQASCRLSDKRIDCGPMDDRGHRRKISWMLEGMDKQQNRRETALDQRNARLAAQVVEREQRYIARKKLEKERQKANLEARRRQQNRDAEL
jgi:hypothetical protein